MRKHLELILTASLSVMILIIGYLAVTSQATIHNNETAYPSGAAPYYRDDAENDEGKKFGPEANSDAICPNPVDDEWNKGFNINGVTETATVTVSTIPGAVEFDRTQTWTFLGETPWNSNSVVIVRSAPVNWDNIDGTTTNRTGYPWSGNEYHSRYFWDADDGGDDRYYIITGSHVTGWKRFERDNRKWICPKHYKRLVGVAAPCGDVDIYWGNEPVVVWKEEFSEPTFRDEAKTILSRLVEGDDDDGRPWFRNVWFNCIELN